MQKMRDILRNKWTIRIGEWVMFMLVMAWTAVLVTRKIDLSTADLGRHLMNGKIWLESSDRWALLHTNLYSYTNQDFSFVNHHWGSGVVFYSIYQWAGFNGLSIFYIALTLLTVGIFFRLAQKNSGTAFAIMSAVLILPIVTIRKEVRPEVFTYLFSGVFYWILLNRIQSVEYESQPLVSKGKGKTAAALWILPIIMLIWVNLHIGFIIGIGIIGVFWLVEVGKYLSFRGVKSFFHQKDSTAGQSFKQLRLNAASRRNSLIILSIILGLSVIAALCNPWGLQGLLYPLNIFRNYGYLIVENQSILFLQRLHHEQGLYFGFFKTIVALVAVSFFGVFIKLWLKRKNISQKVKDQTGVGGILIVNSILVITFGTMAILAIRDFPLFGLFALPIFAYNLKLLVPATLDNVSRKVVAGAALAIAIGICLRIGEDLSAQQQLFGIGLIPGVTGAGQFYKQHNISGPVFNNYDIGGYLIYYLYPSQQVYVDNRPEAYPDSFFQNHYIAAQNDPKAFEGEDTIYHFNSIVFNYHDLTPWAQAFLIRMVHNPAWAPVYVDNFNLILLRRNQLNASVIKAYELPGSTFGN